MNLIALRARCLALPKSTPISCAWAFAALIASVSGSIISLPTVFPFGMRLDQSAPIRLQLRPIDMKLVCRGVDKTRTVETRIGRRRIAEAPAAAENSRGLYLQLLVGGPKLVAFVVAVVVSVRIELQTAIEQLQHFSRNRFAWIAGECRALARHR